MKLREELSASRRQDNERTQIKARKSIQPTLRNTQKAQSFPPPPPKRVPRATQIPRSAPDADTILTVSPMLAREAKASKEIALKKREPSAPVLLNDDAIELVDESEIELVEGGASATPPLPTSGVWSSAASNHSDAIEEVSASFLIDELEGNPNEVPTDDLEELGPDNLRFLEAQGEIQAQPQSPRLPCQGPSVKVGVPLASAWPASVPVPTPGLAGAGVEEVAALAAFAEGPAPLTIQPAMRTERIAAAIPQAPSQWPKLAAAALLGAALVTGGYLVGRNGGGSELEPQPSRAFAAIPADPAQDDVAALAAPAEELEVVPDVLPQVEPLTEEPAPAQKAEENVDAKSVERTIDGMVVRQLGDDETTSQEPAPEATKADEASEGPKVAATGDAPPRTRRRSRAAKGAAPKSEPSVEPVAKKSTPQVATKSASKGMGVLQLGAKPPCEIYVDGRNTRLHTPQRQLKLKEGRHKITLINREHGLRETFTVNIDAGETERVIRDLTTAL